MLTVFVAIVLLNYYDIEFQYYSTKEIIFNEIVLFYWDIKIKVIPNNKRIFSNYLLTNKE